MQPSQEHTDSRSFRLYWNAILWSWLAICVAASLTMAFIVGGGLDRLIRGSGYAWLIVFLVLPVATVVIPGAVTAACVPPPGRHRFFHALLTSVAGWFVAFIPMVIVGSVAVPPARDQAGQGEALGLFAFALVAAGCLVASPTIGYISVVAGQIRDRRQSKIGEAA